MGFINLFHVTSVISGALTSQTFKTIYQWPWYSSPSKSSSYSNLFPTFRGYDEWIRSFLTKRRISFRWCRGLYGAAMKSGFLLRDSVSVALTVKPRLCDLHRGDIVCRWVLLAMVSWSLHGFASKISHFGKWHDMIRWGWGSQLGRVKRCLRQQNLISTNVYGGTFI